MINTSILPYIDVTSKPSLVLDFANSKRLDPRITFTRSSGGTCVGPNGLITLVSADQPRFDHDPTTGVCNGLLIEESRTNLQLQSGNIDNTISPWNSNTAFNTTKIGPTTAPDGTNTAIIYAGNGAGNNEFVCQSNNLSSNTTYTASIWARIVSGTLPTSGQIISAEYNNGVATTRANVSYSNNLTTSWKRFSVTFTNVNALNGAFLFFIADQNNTAQIAVWGAQLEVGSFPTSYIPTTSATVTRSQDNASIVGPNFSSWYNPNEWTLFADMSTPSANLIAAASQAQYVSIDDGTMNNTYAIRCVTDPSTPYIDGYAQFNNNPIADYTGSDGSSFPSRVKAAFVAKNSDSAFCYNGNTVETDTAFTLASTVDRMRIGVNPKAGTIAKILYYPSRLSNTQIKQLTT